MFANIPTNVTRHDTCANCMTQSSANATIDAQKRQDDLVKHFSNILLRWATATKPSDRLASMNNVSVPILKEIDPTNYTSWQTAFEAKGYTVTNDGKHFKVSHS